MRRSRIDLNADLGEGGLYDTDLMSVVTSCNIACGGHAGNEGSMKTALALAKSNGVAAGAHPSFPDRENFGRTQSSMSGASLENALGTQVLTLKQLAAQQDMFLTHLKPHGALYNMAAKDKSLSKTILNVLQNIIPGAMLFGPPNSELQRAACTRQVPFVAEGFADRAYEDDGSLRDRREVGAVIQDKLQQTRQALEMATHQSVTTYQGGQISLAANTICVHGDTPDAFATARAIKITLLENGISLCAPG